MQRTNNTNNNRKRRRNIAQDTSHATDTGLQLVDEAAPQVEKSVPEDSKVINYLSKLNKGQSWVDTVQSVSVRVVVSISEGAYFDEHLDSLDLISHFSIKDVTISTYIPGTIERFINVFGDNDNVSKCLVYIAFLLKVKLNNFNILESSCTLKSVNYSLRILVPQSRPLSGNITHLFGSGLVYLDTALPSAYHSKLGSIELRASFSAMYNFLNHLITEYVDNIQLEDDIDLCQIKLFGNHSDANLFVRSEFNTRLLSKSASRTSKA